MNILRLGSTRTPCYALKCVDSRRACQQLQAFGIAQIAKATGPEAADGPPDQKRRRTRVVGGQSALNPAAARLRFITGTNWSTKRYLNIELLKDQQMRGAITA